MTHTAPSFQTQTHTHTQKKKGSWKTNWWLPWNGGPIGLIDETCIILNQVDWHSTRQKRSCQLGSRVADDVRYRCTESGLESGRREEVADRSVGWWMACDWHDAAWLGAWPAHLTSPGWHELDLPCSAIAGAHSFRFPEMGVMRRSKETSTISSHGRPLNWLLAHPNRLGTRSFVALKPHGYHPSCPKFPDR